MKKIFLIIIILAMFSCAFVSAKTYHMTLLTVGEIGNESFGGTADAYLEVKYGTGRIFLDTFPLTKLDTQISTRYANEIACDHLNMDCSHYDFFYTIRADSTIVGGPSASGSLTILTITALKNLELRKDTVMTGTINSGGSIGPVGGIVKKARAAEEAGFKQVLIPMFSLNLEQINRTGKLNLTNQTGTSPDINSTINQTPQIPDEPSLEEANLTIKVIQVRNIEEALSYFTDTPLGNMEGEINVPQDYTNTMKQVSESLCGRALSWHQKVRLTNEEDINKSNEFIININKSIESEDYYSAASYCFSFGLLLRKANLKEIEAKNPTRIDRIFKATKKAVDEFDQNLENLNITTLSELETYIIVKERLLESAESLVNTDKNLSTDELAYAIERYYSGVYWSEFFKLKGQKMNLDKEYLKEACYKKLSEADERINYAALYIPVQLQSARNTIGQAQAFAIDENYKMCLFKASFAKAESNILLSSLSIGEEHVAALAEEKLRAAKKIIVKEQGRGIFPIMGYSYYEYSSSLKENGDVISSLIFAEYALELSNIEIYFPKKSFEIPGLSFLRANYSTLLLFASAMVMGIAVGMLIMLKVKLNKGRKVPVGRKRRSRRR
jgi:uncharacterized protein